MNVYGPKIECKKHSFFHLEEENCPYCLPDEMKKEDPELEKIKEEYKKHLLSLMWA